MKYIVKKDIPKKDNDTNTIIKKGTELFINRQDYTLGGDDPRFYCDILETKDGVYVMDCSNTCESYIEYIEVKP